MITVTKETLRQLLEQCIVMAMQEAQKQVAELLLVSLYLGLEAFGQRGKELSLDEVMFFLYRNGTFPRVVDVAVKGMKDERTLIWIRPSDHPYVGDFSQTYMPEEMGLFKSIGLMVPYTIWERPRPLSVQDLKEAGEMWLKY